MLNHSITQSFASCAILVSLELSLAIWGSRDGTVVQALALDQCGLGLILAGCHMWVAFFVDSCLAPRVF